MPDKVDKRAKPADQLPTTEDQPIEVTSDFTEPILVEDVILISEEVKQPVSEEQLQPEEKPIAEVPKSIDETADTVSECI